VQAGIRRPWGFHRNARTIIDTLREVVRRVVEAADPEEILLFGSAARGRLHKNSDFDLLVIKAGVEDRSRLKRRIHANFFGLSVPVDVIVITPEEARDARANTWTFLGRALRDGKCVYRLRANGQQRPHGQAARAR
jgi:predicted nucleotidyltransferase